MDTRDAVTIHRRNMELGRYVCVGVDSDQENEGMNVAFRSDDNAVRGISRFNEMVVNQTSEVAAAYKFNLGPYLAQNALEALIHTVMYIKEYAPDALIILDLKAGDIDYSNEWYATFAYDVVGVDAITANPYVGIESLRPLMRDNKMVFILAKTSNKGGEEFQNVPLGDGSGWPLYMQVANHVWAEATENRLGLVAGATYPKELDSIRMSTGCTILIPGIGRQQGDLDATILAATKTSGALDVLVNSSGIIYAPGSPDSRVRNAAESLHKDIRSAYVRALLCTTGALLEGDHFELTHGLHSNAYVNKDAIYPYTEVVQILCNMLVQDFPYLPDGDIVVVGPEKGGIILSQVVAQALNRQPGVNAFSIFAEKTDDGSFVFNRGYDQYVHANNVIIAEDILTTGESVRKVIEVVKALGGNVIGVAAICNRGNVTNDDIGVDRLISLVHLTLKTYPEDECPLCQEGIAVNAQIGKGQFLSKKI